MPFSPNPLERLLFVTFNQAPGPALDLWSGPANRTVLAAIRLGVFEALARQPASAGELAQSLQLDARGTTILLETLTSLGYVKLHADRFSLTAMTHKWLTDAGDINFSPFFQYWGVILERFFPALEESIRSGQPPVNLYDWIENEPQVSRFFQEGMIAITRYVKDDVVKRIPAPTGAARLLDVGGGHAMYSIALCQKHPQLRAVVFDSAQALTTGRASIGAAGMADRVIVQEGNFLKDDLGAGFDLALLFNIVHGLSEEQNLALLHKVRAALNPGGRLVILEQVAGAALTPIQEATTRILGMAYFHLLGGQVYTLADVTRWLATSGFGNVQRKTILKAGSPLLIAERLT